MAHPDSPFSTLGLIGKLGAEQVRQTLKDLIRYLREEGYEILLDRDSVALTGAFQAEAVSRQALGERSDLAIVVGGDGTLLNAARALSLFDVPLVGINLGRLGFLVDISPHEMRPHLDAILHGHYQEERRFLLQGEVYREGERIGHADALNDVVVHKGNLARMIEFETYIDERFVYTQRADGTIVATPTGSTAYVLSAGGPILHPVLNALVIAPICPHTLSNRPMVVDGESTIRILISPHTQDAQITWDGQINLGLMAGDRIEIRKRDHPVRLLHPPQYDYYALLRAKLHWGKHL